MSHIDTLKSYKELISAGYSDVQASAHASSLYESEERIHNSMELWIKEAKEDFASQKLVSILGALILLVGAASVGLMWNLSIDMKVLQKEFSEIKNKCFLQ